MSARPWLWPDRTIGKAESRTLREEHNAAVNELAEYTREGGLILTIACDNAAFYDDDEGDEKSARNPGDECARILRAVAAKIENGHDSGRCTDSNGNNVGRWSLDTPEA